MRNEVFFGGAITPALGHHASAVRDLGGVGEGDVKSMLASARAISHQCRCGTQADQIGARRHQPGCVRPRGPGHRDCGIRAARLCRRKARETSPAPVRRREPAPRSGAASRRDAQQIADRRTAAPVDRERSLAAGRVQCGNQLLPRGMRRAHGACVEITLVPTPERRPIEWLAADPERVRARLWVLVFICDRGSAGFAPLP